MPTWRQRGMLYRTDVNPVIPVIRGVVAVIIIVNGSKRLVAYNREMFVIKLMYCRFWFVVFVHPAA